MKVQRFNFSEHLITDRIERMTNIAITIGFGDIVEEFPDENEYGNTWHCLTDTGVVIIKTEDKEKIITMFAARADRVCAYYKAKKGVKYAPNWLVQVAKNNEKKRPFLFK